MASSAHLINKAFLVRRSLRSLSLASFSRCKSSAGACQPVGAPTAREGFVDLKFAADVRGVLGATQNLQPDLRLSCG